MIVRRITYMAQSGKDMMKWIKNSCQDMRAIKGMRKIEFLRSQSNPEEWGAFMYFNKAQDLTDYKESGPYKVFVKSLSEYADMTKPITDEIFEYLEV